MAAETKEQFQSRALATTASGGAVPARYEAPVQGINTLAYEPTDLDQAFRMAQILVSSGLTPRGVDTPQKAFLIMAQGRELGLSTMQALGNIYVVEGKVSLSSDLMAAMVLKSSVCEYLRVIEMTPERATYAAKRKGGNEFRFSFSWEDATKAGLTGRATYKANPADMLRHRALSKCVRAVFPDVVAGLYSRDEAEDIIDVSPRQTVAEVVHAAAETATTPALPAATKVRRRTTAAPVAASVAGVTMMPVPAPVVVEEEPVVEEAAEQEQAEAVQITEGPHLADDGSVVDPLTGEALDGWEAGLFAQVGGANDEEALKVAANNVTAGKAQLSPDRYQSLAWLYFVARKRVTGKDAPSQYTKIRAI
jgi:hypothetical protein